MSYPAATHISCREWLALGGILLGFVTAVAFIVWQLVRVLRGEA